MRRRQAGCKALMAHYGIGPLVAVTILAELGDCTRFSSLRLAEPAHGAPSSKRSRTSWTGRHRGLKIWALRA